MKMKEKKPKPTYYNSIMNNVGYLLRDIWKEKRILFFLIFIQCLLGIITPLFGIYLPKIAVDLIIDGAGVERVVILLGGFTLCMILTDAIYSMSDRAKYMHYNSMRQTYLTKIFFKSLDCDYKHMESADGQTKFTRAKNTLLGGDGSGTSRMVVAMVSIFISALNFSLYSTIISVLNPLIIVYLFVLTFINYIAMRIVRKYAESRRDEQAEYDKKLSYIANKSSDIKAGKDIRLFNMTNWFLTLRDMLLSKYYEVSKQIEKRYYISAVVNFTTGSLLREGVAYIYLMYMVTTGAISVGDFMLYFGAITGFSGFLSTITWSYNQLHDANTEMNYMREFLEETNVIDPIDPMDINELSVPMSISFKHVYFSYDGKTNVLDDFSFDILAGEKIALVGVNGAGKTTIVKLLCGFYTPNAGEISINGININRFRKKDLFKLFSAVFQDITLLPFTIAENISMRVESETDMDAVRSCIAKAGLADEVAKYEKGIKANMTKIHEDGVVLSGGQQQKLLMARALYKDAPLLILDEPTAALDPIAESETYEKFHELSRNKTSIYISHRLASTRFCDRIAFLKDGRISESGSHTELMNQGGDYANMFEIQSHYYKKGVAVNER